MVSDECFVGSKVALVDKIVGDCDVCGKHGVHAQTGAFVARDTSTFWAKGQM